jgi:hypothetical protein
MAKEKTPSKPPKPKPARPSKPSRDKYEKFERRGGDWAGPKKAVGRW